MKNLDLLKQKQALFAKQFKDALNDKDDDALVKAFQTYSDNIQQGIIDAINEAQFTADNTVLANRGIRQLTSAEQKFYENLGQAMKATDAKQALTDFDLTIPQTIIDSVVSDMANNHPLLAALNIQNTYGNVKWLFADDTQNLAQWGQINTAIAKEIAETVHTLEFSLCKLSAFIPVPKDLIILAPAYLDAYVRRLLADALAYGLEYGYIGGTGKNMPIGMIKDLSGAVTDGEYADKTKVSLKALDVKSYCGVVSKLAKKTTGKTRVVSKVTLIVNPVDYIEKIIPATTVLATDGSYKNNIFPFPTEVIQSEMVEVGTAVMGILSNYMACLSTTKEGKVDYSDQYQFIEDNRVYLIKLIGTGRAKDNNDFIYLDISKLEALKLSVTLENATEATT